MKQSAIIWPDVTCQAPPITLHPTKSLSPAGAQKIWAQLNDTTLWPNYYSNAEDIRFQTAAVGNRAPTPASASTLAFRLRRRRRKCSSPVDGEAARILPGTAGWEGGERASGCDPRLAV